MLHLQFQNVQYSNNNIYINDLFPYFEHPIMRCTNNKLMFVWHDSQVSHKVHVGVAMGGVCVRLRAPGGRGSGRR